MQPDLILGDNKLEAKGGLDISGDLVVDGDAKVKGHVQAPMTFERAATPLLHIFDGGTNNPDRPVISHSPAFQDWGLLYRDRGDMMIFQGNGNPALTIDLSPSGGRVGVNTDQPSHALHINGSAAGTQGFETLSDARCKENIESITDAVDVVRALRGVRFDWRTDACEGLDVRNGRQIGLVAQEVEHVVPEVVSQPDGRYRTVDYGALIPILTEAIKEQQAKLDAQNKALNLLERENSTLRTTMGELERRIERVEKAHVLDTPARNS
jgi:hypothetical protein